MNEYLTYHRIYVYLGSTWVDISQYVVSSIKGFWGINGNEVTDRVATTGEISFELNNAAALFTPGLGTTLPGFEIGAEIKLVVGYDLFDRIKFLGKISDIEINTETWGERRVRVTALDWMNNASISNVVLQGVLLNKNINDSVAALLPFSAFQPAEVDYASYGVVDTFPTVFDIGSKKTKILSEFSKLANSEFGFIYLRHAGQYGEQLVTEGRNGRNSGRTYLELPVAVSMAEKLQLEDGINLLHLEDGVTPLSLDELETFSFSNNFTSAIVKNGSRITTNITIDTFPRRVDTSLQVLFAITNPISLGNGETKTFRSYYVDTYGNKINGITLQTPVVTTDYQMFANSDGTGMNLSANLSVTAVYGSEAVDYTVTNTGATPGYVTKLQARGYGIYSFNTLTYSNESANMSIYGDIAKNLNMKYQNDISVAEFVGDKILDNYDTSFNTLESVTTLANSNPRFLMGFLFMDIGDLVQVSLDSVGIDGDFFVQSIKFDITTGGLLTYTVGFTDALSLTEFYWELQVAGRSELNTTTIISS